MTYIEEIDIRMLPSVRGKTLKETMEGLNPKAPVSISGGFGYSKEDAIVIEKPNQELPFDGVALEHFVAKARLLMEAGVIRYNGEKFRVFDIKRGNQFLVKGESSQVYDHLEYTVVLAYESKLEDLKKILQKHRAEGTGLTEEEEDQYLVAFEADLWFEASSFFSKTVEERGLIDILADAWRNLDATELLSFIHEDFQYDSQWVFATMHADEYPSYIRGKFDTIRKTGAAPTVEIVPDRSLGGRMIKLVQRKDVGYLRIKEKDGKIVKMDMCMF